MKNPVRPDEYAYYLPLVGDSMFELGGKVNGKLGTYKAWFESLGFRHVSVDWNGENGALVRDLRTPLWEEFGQFSMISNVGCSEHVSDQRGCWENIHELAKVGGVYVGQCPYYDGKSWWWHGDYYPTEKFYTEFAQLNGWVIERMGTDLPEPHKNLYVRMRKRANYAFTMPDESLIVSNKKRSKYGP